MRWRKPVLVVAVFVVALEGALQLGALVAAATRSRAAVPNDAAVVCLGDSYTYGIGASSPETSYPAQLQALLRARGLDVAVANGGCPGQDSAFMLRRLPSLLTPRTRVLCVVMSTNDSWSHPAPVAADEFALRMAAPPAASGGFELRWRTGRLLALCWRFAAGTWSRTGDATAGTAYAPDERHRDAVVDPPAGFALLEALGVIPAVPEMPALIPPCPAELQRSIDEVTRLAAANATAQAREVAIATEAAHPGCPQALQTLVVAAERAGDHELAKATLARLSGLAATGDAAAECHVLALAAIGRSADVVIAARARVAREPGAVFAWNALQQAAYVLGDWDEFMRAAAATLRLTGRLSPPDTAHICRNQAHVLAATAPGRAASLLVAATLIDGNVGLLRFHVNSLRASVPWSHFDEALAAVHSTRQDGSDALRRLLATLHQGEPGNEWAVVLQQHLLLVGDVCRQRGVRLVVMSYPFFQPELEAVQRAAAEALGALFVPARERFDRELQTRTRDQLFVRDGHCNDAGYALLAEAAAAVIAPLLR